MSEIQAREAGVSPEEYHEIMREMHNELDNARIMDEIHSRTIDRLEKISEGRIKVIRYASD